MSFQEIKNMLENQNHHEVCKAIFSFETGIEDETFLDSLVEYYMSDKYIPNFLDENIHDKVLEYNQKNN